MASVAIQQPTYLPWLGYFEQIAQSDVFVFLDSVQLEKQSWQTRNQLRTISGETFWLSVPIERMPLEEALIRDIKVNARTNWNRKHLASIKACLGRAPYFDEIYPIVESQLSAGIEGLADLNISLITAFARALDLKAKFVRATELNITGAKTELVTNICRAVGATRYYSPAGSAVYLEPEPFAQNNIELVFQNWPHPTYPQMGSGFVSHLSVVDALMNAGCAHIRDLIASESLPNVIQR